MWCDATVNYGGRYHRTTAPNIPIFYRYVPAAIRWSENKKGPNVGFLKNATKHIPFSFSTSTVYDIWIAHVAACSNKAKPTEVMNYTARARISTSLPITMNNVTQRRNFRRSIREHTWALDSSRWYSMGVLSWDYCDEQRKVLPTTTWRVTPVTPMSLSAQATLILETTSDTPNEGL